MSWKNHLKINIFCILSLATQKKYILKFNQYMKSDKTTCITNADLESLIKKIVLKIIQRNLQQQK